MCKHHSDGDHLCDQWPGTSLRRAGILPHGERKGRQVQWVWSYDGCGLMRLVYTAIGFKYDWSSTYTVTEVTSPGPADQILKPGDKITKVHNFFMFQAFFHSLTALSSSPFPYCSILLPIPSLLHPPPHSLTALSSSPGQQHAHNQGKAIGC